MTRLPESSSWEEEIELISRNERVSGGLDGVANRPLKILASRTRYLRDQAETADESIAEKVSAVKTFAEGATLESPREEILFDSYRLVWTGEFPKTVLAGSTPQGSGGIGAGRWAYTSDAVIRQDLSSREYGLGAYLDGWARNDSCEVAANVAVFLSAQKINLWEYKNLCVPKADD
ncbi:tail fiber/spike domain-containing protein, partial [Klebsiella quasipneumoniae]|uniref:tail fiber/spike domain-containing protein n=1 Tax=Klebsiella quasipneumoniae TaxID=1463165 RepID=UPI004053467F